MVISYSLEDFPAIFELKSAQEELDIGRLSALGPAPCNEFPFWLEDFTQLTAVPRFQRGKKDGHMEVPRCASQLFVEVIIQVEGASAGERPVMLEGVGRRFGSEGH